MNGGKPSTSKARLIKALSVRKPVTEVKKTLSAQEMLDKMYADSQRSYYAIRRNPIASTSTSTASPTAQPKPKTARVAMGESTALYKVFQDCKDCGYKFPHIDGFLYHVTEEHSLSADEIRALLVSAPFFRRSNRLGIRKLTSALNVAKEDRDLILKILLGPAVPKEDEKATESEEEYFKNDIHHIPDMALEPYLFKYSGVNNASTSQAAKQPVVRVRAIGKPGVRPILKPMVMTKNIRPTPVIASVTSKTPYGVSKAGMGRKAYFTTASGEVRTVITVPRAVPGFIPKIPPKESCNEFLKQKEAPHPCKCKSEMRVVVDRTFSLEQKSVELMNELREMLARPVPQRRQNKRRLNLMENLPGKVVLPKVMKPAPPPEPAIIDEITLSSSDSDDHPDGPSTGGLDDLHEMDDLSEHLSDEDEDEAEEVEEEPEDDPGCARARIVKRKPKKPVQIDTDTDEEEIITDEEEEGSPREQGSPDVITLSDDSEHDKSLKDEESETDSHEEMEAEKVPTEDMSIQKEEATVQQEPDANVLTPRENEIPYRKPVLDANSFPSSTPVVTFKEPRPIALPSVELPPLRRLPSPTKPRSPVKLAGSPTQLGSIPFRRPSPIKAVQPQAEPIDPEVAFALKGAAWLRNGEPKTVAVSDGKKEVHHPTEARIMSIEELLLCVCRLILTVKDRNITTIGFGVSTGDHEWMNTVEDNLITLALHHLVDAGLMTSGNMVFSKLRKNQIEDFKKSELALASYGLKANEYFT